MVSRALDLFDRALALDPNYPPALLYRGQVLYEVRKDVPGAIKSWEKFVAVTPPGEDRDRVAKMLADARGKAGGKR
jgi:tetratricopeptide (TPR) repeat protein